MVVLQLLILEVQNSLENKTKFGIESDNPVETIVKTVGNQT